MSGCPFPTARIPGVCFLSGLLRVCWFFPFIIPLRIVTSLLERLQYVLGNSLRLFVRYGLLVKPRHSRPGVPHLADNICGLSDAVRFQCFFMDGLCGIDDIATVGMADGAVLHKCLLTRQGL